MCLFMILTRKVSRLDSNLVDPILLNLLRLHNQVACLDLAHSTLDTFFFILKSWLSNFVDFSVWDSSVYRIVYCEAIATVTI